MTDWLESVLEPIFGIFEMLGILIDFAIGLIKDLIKVVDMLGKIVLDLPEIFDAFLPPGVAGIFLVLISVTVIYRITARD